MSSEVEKSVAVFALPLLLPLSLPLRCLLLKAKTKLVGQGAAVGSHFAGGGVDAIDAVHAVFDAFIAAVAAVGGADGPAESDEGLARGFGDAGFEAEDTHWAEAGCVFTHGLRAAFVVPARAVASGLDVEAVVDAVDDDLCLALRLHVAAHDPEGHPGLAILGSEAGDDGLEGALAGGVDVGMSVLEGKELSAVLEHE